MGTKEETHASIKTRVSQKLQKIGVMYSGYNDFLLFAQEHRTAVKKAFPPDAHFEEIAIRLAQLYIHKIDRQNRSIVERDVLVKHGKEKEESSRKSCSGLGATRKRKLLRNLLVDAGEVPKVKQLQQSWDWMFLELKAYYNDHGNCLVHTRKSKLGRWVHNQRLKYRLKYKNGISSWGSAQLTQEQISLMDNIGFLWKLAVPWNERFLEMKEFRDRHGHCHATRKDGKLGIWADNQRQSRRKSKLSDDRIQKLDTIGFIWKRGWV